MTDNRIYIDRGWRFEEFFTDEMVLPGYDESMMEDVIIPHTVSETPFNYFDESIYQMVSCYRRHIFAKDEWKGMAVLLTFEGVAHEAKVYVNGAEVCTHVCGYTAFTIDISDKLSYGEDNVIAVRVDSNETLNQPPFGFAIDYMTYGGIYRDVYLEVRSRSYISRTAIDTKLTDRYDNEGIRYCKKGAAVTKVYIENASDDQKLITLIRKKGESDFTPAAETPVSAGYTETTVRVDDVELWDPENPVLYEQKMQLVDAAGSVIDSYTDTFGFRKVVFKTNGFFINGRKLKIRGLNRHQSYPYVGYAMPHSMQRLDARILKEELGVNAVRTSHYPQDQSFLDECDRIGLLVFTEIPGWQHIGDNEWKDKAVDNVKDMIRQNINHPSIILWGVRINESVDDEEFYARTNAMAHTEDPTRQTGGVRCYKKGKFQEDVFTYNDFVHFGTNAAISNRASVTPDTSKPYLITEYNGHMYPTKSYDTEDHRCEHMLRHARILDAVAKEEEITGSFGWCMFDYNTHKDFGSGDRICYHGVCDMFRNPKLAAHVYSAQQDRTPVLEISSAMNIGEHPGGNMGRVYIISNADSVRMYKNDEFVAEYTSRDSEFKNLAHGPVRIKDFVGDALETHEGMSHKKAEDVKSIINEVSEKGVYRLSVPIMAKAAMVAAKHHMGMQDAFDLYGKYIGNWGGKANVYKFEAVTGGDVVKELIVSPSTRMHIEAEASTDTLYEGNTYDAALVRIRAVDENGGLLSFANEPLMLETQGPIEIIGPDVISLMGGMSGVYVRTTGVGEASLTITNNRKECTTVGFNVIEKK